MDELINQIGEYLNKNFNSEAKDLLQKCYIQFKKIKENNN